jgi:murein DD-endopeptidase MepM/ murein hydrolase activator NlpD
MQTLSRRASRPRIAVAAALALVLGAALAVAHPEPSYAVEYPSWDEVEQARYSASAAQGQADELGAIIETLRGDAERAQADADDAAEQYRIADAAYQEGFLRMTELQQQADDAATSAREAESQTGALAMQIARTGSVDLGASLLTGTTDASGADLLDRLARATHLGGQVERIRERAEELRNTAQSLTDQARVAAQELLYLRDEADARQTVALDAASAAQQALDTQQQHEAELQAQVAYLTDVAAATEGEWRAGEAERIRIAEAEAQRLADEARAALAAAGVTVSTDGWILPSTGSISSSFGMRIHPVYGTARFHAGTDIAGGCGVPIVAAHDGTVEIVGRNGGAGNFVQLDHGGGVSTQYAHIRDGGTVVGYGQQVSAGQLIAYTGSTGASTGCHLHYEVRVNGTVTDPVPFMRNMGVSLG